MKFRFFYDAEFKDEVENSQLSLIEELISSSDVFSPEKIQSLAGGEKVLLYISDEQLKSLLPSIINRDLKFAFLPHPQSTFAMGMGVDRNFQKAVSFLKETAGSVKVDMLYCNGEPVFKSVITGQTFELTGDNYQRVKGVLNRFFKRVKTFFSYKPFKADVYISEEKKLKTAVSGIICSEHRRSSFLTRLLMDNTSVDDKLFHTFFVSPRSIFELLSFSLRSVFIKNKFPPFAAHFKSSSMVITFPEGERDYVIDTESRKAEKLDFKVEEKVVDVFPGSNLQLSKNSANNEEVFKVNALPFGDAADALANRKLPLIRYASYEEFKDLFEILRGNAVLKGSYLVLMALSTILATFGLFSDSTPVVIGAMILAPLMSPIISLSMGALRQDKMLLTNSVKTIFAGLAVSLLFAVLITLLTPINIAGHEIVARTRPNIIDLGIAIVSGIAGAYAHAREEVAKTLAGVAIAVALVPPLAVTGIGIGWADWSVFSGAALLFATNLAGMVLAASITFMLLGFSPLSFLNKGMVSSLLLVVLLCIPLVFGFKQMVYQHNIVSKLEGFETEYGIVRDVNVYKVSPVEISIRLVSHEYVDDYKLNNLKSVIEERIDNEEISIEIVTAILK
ncbi:TIGR00341 family protein [Marinilabiliaceae bacterium ANBcel2]|nr:TIGR00341 family protein [Marinilabiliaceae bacterium ANBcel2]